MRQSACAAALERAAGGAAQPQPPAPFEALSWDTLWLAVREKDDAKAAKTWEFQFSSLRLLARDQFLLKIGRGRSPGACGLLRSPASMNALAAPKQYLHAFRSIVNHSLSPYIRSRHSMAFLMFGPLAALRVLRLSTSKESPEKVG